MEKEFIERRVALLLSGSALIFSLIAYFKVVDLKPQIIEIKTSEELPQLPFLVRLDLTDYAQIQKDVRKDMLFLLNQSTKLNSNSITVNTKWHTEGNLKHLRLKNCKFEETKPKNKSENFGKSVVICKSQYTGTVIETDYYNNGYKLGILRRNNISNKQEIISNATIEIQAATKIDSKIDLNMDIILKSPNDKTEIVNYFISKKTTSIKQTFETARMILIKSISVTK